MDCSFCPWNSLDKNTGVGKPFPSQGDLPDPGMKPGFPTLQADSLPTESLLGIFPNYCLFNKTSRI